MKFYNELSKVYDIVFPKDEQTLKFLRDNLKGNSKILDLACGTGTYSIALAQKGHRVDAVDLDEEMIRLAKGKGGLYVNFVMGDMTKIKDTFDKEMYDLIFCIGNSIVHLKSKEKIAKFIKDIHDKLNDGGAAVIQIINYDRVLKQDIKELPIIDRPDKGVKFIRNYNHKEEQKIEFKTELTVTHDGKTERFENTVDLITLQEDELLKMMKDVGFKHISLYGDFSGERFNEESFALIVKGFKV